MAPAMQTRDKQSRPHLLSLVALAALLLIVSGCHVEAASRSTRKLMQAGPFQTATGPNTSPPTLPPSIQAEAPRTLCGPANVQITWSCPFNVASLVTPGRRMGLWRFTVTHNCPGPTAIESLQVITANNFNTTGENGYLNPLGTAGLVGCSGGTCQLAEVSAYSGPYFDPSTLQDETVMDLVLGNLDIHNAGEPYVFLYQDPTKKCGQGEPQFSFIPDAVEFYGQ